MPSGDHSQANTVAGLVRHFESIYCQHMQSLPIVNRRMQVEAVGFQDFEGHQLGVLITPWFMNLVLLPGAGEWQDSAQGDTSSIGFPCGPIEFTTSRDEAIGTYLTAVLYRDVSDLPNQSTARATAIEAMSALFAPACNERSFSRRDVLTGLRSR